MINFICYDSSVTNNSNLTIMMSHNHDEDVRIPDEAFEDQLLPTNGAPRNNEQELDHIMALSLREYNLQQEKFFEKQMEEVKQNIRQRTELLRPIREKFDKIGKYDAKVKEIYDILHYVFESFELLIITSYEFDELTYTNLMNIVCKIRFSERELAIIKDIVRCEGQ